MKTFKPCSMVPDRLAKAESELLTLCNCCAHMGRGSASIQAGGYKQGNK